MSITIHKEPQDLSPVYNQMIIAVTGSYQSNPNHNFVANVFCNGVNVSRVLVPANPDGYGVFDIHKHIENRISYDFNPNWQGLNIATNSFATYSVTFGEQFRYEWPFYDNTFITGGFVAFVGLSGSGYPLFATGSQIVVQQSTPFSFSQYEGEAIITGITFSSLYNSWALITNKGFQGSTPPQGGTISLANFELTTINSTYSVGTNYAWNGVYSFLDFINYNENDYIPNTTTPANWLSNVPQNWEVDINDRMWLLAYKNAANQQKDLMVQSNKGTFKITSPFSTNPTGLPNQRLVSAAVGPYNLISGSSSWSAVGGGSTFPIIDGDTKTYSVWYRNQILQQDTETLIFKISDRCSKYEKIQLSFMDKLGSFIPFTFNLVSRHNKAIQRTDWGQLYGSYAPASQAWNYNSWDRGRSNLDTMVTETYTITSDWINQSQSDFLMELFESPEVYWINESGTTIAINITTNSVERKKVINEQLINYQLTFELSNKNNNQKG